MSQTQLDTIIKTLQHAAGYGWEAVYRQQIITAVQLVIWGAILGVLALVLIQVTKYTAHECIKIAATNKGKYSYDKDDTSMGYGAIAIFSACSVVGCILGMIACFSEGIARLINPAGYAINSILGH